MKLKFEHKIDADEGFMHTDFGHTQSSDHNL